MSPVSKTIESLVAAQVGKDGLDDSEPPAINPARLRLIDLAPHARGEGGRFFAYRQGQPFTLRSTVETLFAQRTSSAVFRARTVAPIDLTAPIVAMVSGVGA